MFERLKTVTDPELGVNIVDLGLVYKVNLNENGKVNLDMTLTARGCPISNVIKYEVEEALKGVPGVNGVTVNFVWEPEWNTSMIKPDALKKLKSG